MMVLCFYVIFVFSTKLHRQTEFLQIFDVNKLLLLFIILFFNHQHQYRACDQAVQLADHLPSSNLDIPKNGRLIIPFKKFCRLRMKSNFLLKVSSLIVSSLNWDYSYIFQLLLVTLRQLFVCLISMVMEKLTTLNFLG